MLSCSALLFDFGGTLAAVHPYHECLFIRPCREFGVAVEAARVRAAQDAGWEAYQTPEGPAHPHASRSAAAFARFKTALLAERLRQMGVTGPVAAIAARVLELDTRPEMYRVFDEVVPALEGLKARGYRLAVVSNHEWELPALVGGLGLAGYFAAVITSARVGYRKPHPRIYREALEALGVGPEAALMVGDSPATDIAGARRLGLGAVLLDRAGRQEGLPEVPAIRSLTSLLDLL